MEDLERAPEREQLLIRAWNSHLAGKNEEAAALYARAAEAFPTDKMTLYLAGDFHLALGSKGQNRRAQLQLRARRPAETLRTLEEARPTWSTHAFVHASLYGSFMRLEAEAYEQLGQRERARALSQQLVEWWKLADADAVDLLEARRRLGTR